mgnify:CR=1 FL=1
MIWNKGERKMKELIMFAVLALASAVMAAQPPNIILILADDQGHS